MVVKSAFRIEITTSEEEGNWSRTGIDQVVYMISTNPGEPLRQLEHIASGGELSRLMLALKVSVETDTSTASKKESVARVPSPPKKAGGPRSSPQSTLGVAEIETVH